MAGNPTFGHLSNPYSPNKHASPLPGFSGQKFGSSGVNPHSISGAEGFPDANPHAIRVESIDAQGTSHILNDAARSAIQPHGHTFGGRMPDTSHPIVGLEKTADKQPAQTGQTRTERARNTTRKPPLRPTTKLSWATAEPAGQIEGPNYSPLGMPTVSHPLYGAVVRMALPVGSSDGALNPTAVYAPGSGPIATPFRFNSAAGMLLPPGE